MACEKHGVPDCEECFTDALTEKSLQTKLDEISRLAQAIESEGRSLKCLRSISAEASGQAKIDAAQRIKDILDT